MLVDIISGICRNNKEKGENMSSISSMLKVLDSVPNVPFFTGPITKAVKDLAKSLGLTGSGIHVKSDSLGLYITLKRGKPTQRIFLCSHLDHPGFVFNQEGNATPLGSVGGLGNQGIASISQPTLMDLYQPNGKYLGTTQVTTHGNTLISENQVRSNTVGMWYLSETSYSGPQVRMRSADNHVATVMILSTASRVWNSSTQDVDLVLVFTSIEEVFQISMTGMCLKKNVGKPIREDDCFIVVEAMEMKGGPNYSGGPLIKVNDDEVGYGCRANAVENSAEMLLLNASAPYRHQHSYSGGYTDATALSLLTNCPNIATLAIPCRNKHNIQNGVITTEVVQTEDISTGIEILVRAVSLREWSPVGLLSTNLRESFPKRMRSERVTKYKQNRARMAWGFYYPTSIIHWLGLVLNRVL